MGVIALASVKLARSSAMSRLDARGVVEEHEIHDGAAPLYDPD